jgi:hypothetical protein
MIRVNLSGHNAPYGLQIGGVRPEQPEKPLPKTGNLAGHKSVVPDSCNMMAWESGKASHTFNV